MLFISCFDLIGRMPKTETRSQSYGYFRVSPFVAQSLASRMPLLDLPHLGLYQEFE
ncbi:hypothetical protein Hanom_Chr02g00155631 [Helianthus anomalus]